MRRSRSLNWIFLLIPLVGLAVLIGWRVTQKRVEAADNAKSSAARRNTSALVETAPVKRRTIVKTFEAVGGIEAPATVQLAPKVTGRLMSLSVREGDPVTAGQIIASIDQTETQANVRSAQAAYAEARSRLAEAKMTQGSQAVGVQTDIQKQVAALNTARAQNRQAKADYDASIATAQAALTSATGKLEAAEADIRDADAAIVSAKASLANAKSQNDRQQALLQKGYVSEQSADTTRTAMEVQQATLNAAVEKRSNAVAARDSAKADQQSAQHQVDIAAHKAQADVAVANATVAQSQAALSASQANTAQTPAYRENLAALASAADAAEADLRAAQSRLSDTDLRAPLNGLVTARLLEPGAIVTTTTPIVALQSVRRVWATVSVPEETAHFLYPAQSATVTLDALPGQTFTGKIAQILPSADPQSRQFTVRVALDNPSYRLRPGTFARVTFITEKAANILSVPQEAIHTDPNDPDAKTVLVVGADETAQSKSVTTGMSDDKGIAIKGDIAEGDKVIVLSQREVKPGQKVRLNTDKQKGGKGGGNKKGGKGGKGGQEAAQ